MTMNPRAFFPSNSPPGRPKTAPIWIRRLLVVIGAFFVFTSALVYNVVTQLEGSNHEDFGSNRFRRRSALLPGDNGIPDDIPEDTTPLQESVKNAVNQMRTTPQLETVDTTLPYDIHRCPENIPEGYPIQWDVVDVLSHWNPDETSVPPQIYQGLCTLDWRDPEQRRIAAHYRQSEAPFLIHNHADIWRTAERWSHFDYMNKQLGGPRKRHRNEHGHGNHLPYWKLTGHERDIPGWKPPTEMVELSFAEWHEKALELENLPAATSRNITANAEHWYLRLKADTSGRNPWIYEDLPMFRPKKNFFMPEPDGERGINCRLGSKGILAELHYDFSRNFIFMLHGQKRYLLAHPNQCLNLELHPKGHPSARHSRINWSDPNDWHTGNFAKSQVNEVVMQAGDAMYLPTSWFHLIVSLNLNYQCNARSGIGYENYRAIQDCGF